MKEIKLLSNILKVQVMDGIKYNFVKQANFACYDENSYFENIRDYRKTSNSSSSWTFECDNEKIGYGTLKKIYCFDSIEELKQFQNELKLEKEELRKILLKEEEEEEKKRMEEKEKNKDKIKSIKILYLDHGIVDCLVETRISSEQEEKLNKQFEEDGYFDFGEAGCEQIYLFSREDEDEDEYEEKEKVESIGYDLTSDDSMGGEPFEGLSLEEILDLCKIL